MGPFVGLLQLDLIIPSSNSLKDKRRIVKSLTQRLKNRFNASVKEISGQDLLQRASIGVAVVSLKESEIREVFSRMVQHILEEFDLELLSSNISVYSVLDGEGEP